MCKMELLNVNNFKVFKQDIYFIVNLNEKVDIERVYEEKENPHYNPNLTNDDEYIYKTHLYTYNIFNKNICLGTK